MSLNKVYEDNEGHSSSARVIGLAVIGNAILMLWACIGFGFLHPESFIGIIGVATGLFTGVTTGTFVYLYNNKAKELDATKTE